MTVLGISTETQELVEIDYYARSRGIYMVGSTGTGKTTLLKSIEGIPSFLIPAIMSILMDLIS